MEITVQPSAVSGTIQAPASKSAMQRGCAAALLHNGTTEIINPGTCNDDMAAVDMIQRLGAEVELAGGKLLVKSKGVRPVNTAVNCGESGLGIRMFTPLAALSEQQIIIQGTGSLLTRPMNFFDEVLPRLGVAVQSNGGKLPLTVKGPLVPQNIAINGSLSSQFLTGLLMAFAKGATRPVTITVDDLKSKPYIDLTLQVLDHFGYDVTHTGYETFVINPVIEKPAGKIMYRVEGDWSGAAFLLVAGAIAGAVKVVGLDIYSAQADRAILDALRLSGAGLKISEEAVTVTKAALKAFHFDATDCPDLFPPLVALAACCSEGTTVIDGVGRLAHKESNRALTLQQEFGKMGIVITLQDDLMLIKGGQQLKGAAVHSRHDHRIAMACAVAALRADGPVTIGDADAVNKSYPAFWNDLKKLQQQGA
jgi:3-phosphoshikimate 1-carboxyvinyltransferase